MPSSSLAEIAMYVQLRICNEESEVGNYEFQMYWDLASAGIASVEQLD